MNEKPDIQEHHCYVIKVYYERSSQTWFTVISKDAIVTHKTTKHVSKLGALREAWAAVGQL